MKFSILYSVFLNSNKVILKNIKWTIFSFILILQMLNWSKYFWDTLNSMGLFGPKKVYLRAGHVAYFFWPRMRPKTFLQYFALEQRKYKAKHCRNVLGCVLGQKNKLHAPPLDSLFFMFSKVWYFSSLAEFFFDGVVGFSPTTFFPSTFGQH